MKGIWKDTEKMFGCWFFGFFPPTDAFWWKGEVGKCPNPATQLLQTHFDSCLAEKLANFEELDLFFSHQF